MCPLLYTNTKIASMDITKDNLEKQNSAVNSTEKAFTDISTEINEITQSINSSSELLNVVESQRMKVVDIIRSVSDNSKIFLSESTRFKELAVLLNKEMTNIENQSNSLKNSGDELEILSKKRNKLKQSIS